MKPVVWSAQALSDLSAIKEYISHDSPEYAAVYVSKILAKGDGVSVFPNSGREVPETELNFIREVYLGDYRIIYSIMEDCINILTVHHGNRKLRILE